MNLNMNGRSEGGRTSEGVLQVFLCHSSSDKPVVRDLYRRLKADGFDPWLDEEEILPGQRWEREIKKAVRASDVVVVCISNSIERAGYLHREIREILDVADEQPENVIYVIPAKLEECSVPERLQRYQWVNLFEEKGYERLLRGLRRRAGLQDRVASAPQLASEGSQAVTITVHLFDGTRNPLRTQRESLIRILDGEQREVTSTLVEAPSVLLSGLPHFGDLRDSFTLIVSSKGCRNVGFAPVRIQPGTHANVFLMLLEQEITFDFRGANWRALEREPHSSLFPLLSRGASDSDAAQDRYVNLIENDPASVAGLLNATTILSNMRLPGRNLVAHIKELDWSTIEPDRFLAWAEPELLNQVLWATDHGLLQQEGSAALFHRGPTRSFKEVQKGDAHLILTFHENDRRVVEGIECVMVEVWLDYFRDSTGVLMSRPPSTGRHGYGMADPSAVYSLRWMAARNLGAPEFEPPYVLA
jgi:hypothetical protein